MNLIRYFVAIPFLFIISFHSFIQETKAVDLNNKALFLTKSDGEKTLIYFSSGLGFYIKNDFSNDAEKIVKSLGISPKIGSTGIEAYADYSKNLDVIDDYFVNLTPILAPFDKDKYPIIFFGFYDAERKYQVYARFPMNYGENSEYDGKVYQIKCPDLVNALGFQDARREGFVEAVNPIRMFSLNKDDIGVLSCQTSKNSSGFFFNPDEIRVDYEVSEDTGEINYYFNSPYDVPFFCEVSVSGDLIVYQPEENEKSAKNDQVIVKEKITIKSVPVYPKNDLRRSLPNKVSFNSEMIFQNKIHPNKYIKLSDPSVKFDIKKIEFNNSKFPITLPLIFPESENELDDIPFSFLQDLENEGNEYASFLIAEKYLNNSGPDDYKTAYDLFLHIVNTTNNPEIRSNAYALLGFLQFIGKPFVQSIKTILKTLDNIELKYIKSVSTLFKLKMLYTELYKKQSSLSNVDKNDLLDKLILCSEWLAKIDPLSGYNALLSIYQELSPDKEREQFYLNKVNQIESTDGLKE